MCVIGIAATSGSSTFKKPFLGQAGSGYALSKGAEGAEALSGTYLSSSLWKSIKKPFLGAQQRLYREDGSLHYSSFCSPRYVLYLESIHKVTLTQTLTSGVALPGSIT